MCMRLNTFKVTKSKPTLKSVGFISSSDVAVCITACCSNCPSFSRLQVQSGRCSPCHVPGGGRSLPVWSSHRSLSLPAQCAGCHLWPVCLWLLGPGYWERMSDLWLWSKKLPKQPVQPGKKIILLSRNQAASVLTWLSGDPLINEDCFFVTFPENKKFFGSL